MSEPRKLYWDSSCFISYLNENERERREICEDILEHARNNAVEIWTSTFTIVEVIRPRWQVSAPLPEWAVKAIEAVEEEFPEARRELETLWQRHQSAHTAARLTAEEIKLVSAMFEWEFVQKIVVDEPVANAAVKLARDFGLKSADAIHAASAMVRKVDVLQRWDRDFDKVRHLITVEDPKMMSVPPPLWGALAEAEKSMALRLEGKADAETRETERKALNPFTADVPRGGVGLITGQTASALGEGTAEPTAGEEGSQDGQPEENGKG
ncbi:MAG TPA: PIN domain-containing protein [Pyrinomonadaceae bacterium]|nr:PIN domain-containing protein [Pyrinomonadaceae bacterium]